MSGDIHGQIRLIADEERQLIDRVEEILLDVQACPVVRQRIPHDDLACALAGHDGQRVVDDVAYLLETVAQGAVLERNFQRPRRHFQSHRRRLVHPSTDLPTKVWLPELPNV